MISIAKVCAFLTLSFLLGTNALALEKKLLRFEEANDEWNAGSTCIVRYFNVCNGWVWCWSDFDYNGKLGVVVDACCDDNHALLETAVFVCDTAFHSYGFNGSIAVHNVDGNDCPSGAPIEIRPFVPDVFPYTVTSWGGVQVPDRFALVITTYYFWEPSPFSFATDHPAAGPTGPAACGNCYPANRTTRSFYYGNSSNPLCPGSPFNDGTCNAELIWHILLSCTTSVEQSTWGNIKNLYH